jgi:dGTPase
MINTLVIDLTQTTLANIKRHNPLSVDDVRKSPALAAFSPAIRQQANELKRFLLDNLYRHYRVLRMTTKARSIVRDLFVGFLNDPRLLAQEHRRDDEQAQARAIADYIAGMTDRYATREHRHLFRMEHE